MARRRTFKNNRPFRNDSGAVAYCVRCRGKRSMSNVRKTTTRKGRDMLKGRCTKCGTKMNKFI